MQEKQNPKTPGDNTGLLQEVLLGIPPHTHSDQCPFSGPGGRGSRAGKVRVTRSCCLQGEGVKRSPNTQGGSFQDCSHRLPLSAQRCHIRICQKDFS